MGLLKEGNEVWLTKNDDPNRKLKYTLEIIKVNENLIGVNTHRANRIVEHGLKNKLFNEFKKVKLIKPEFKFSKDTRFDFLCDKKIIEVKNVTLTRENKIAEFPDAITSRGTKHLKKLVDSNPKLNFNDELYSLLLVHIFSILVRKHVDMLILIVNHLDQRNKY